MSPGELIEPGYNTEASTRNIAREAQNINDENDHATTRKSPMEPAGTSPSTELHHLGDSARNIEQEAQNVNEVDKLGNVLAYDISGIRKSTGRGLDGSTISADALDQSIDNSSIPNNPQDVNDENSHITSSWIQQRRVHTP